MPKAPSRSMTHAGHGCAAEQEPLLPQSVPQIRAVGSMSQLKSTPTSTERHEAPAQLPAERRSLASIAVSPLLTVSKAVLLFHRRIWGKLPITRQSTSPSFEHATVTLDNATGDLVVEADGARTVISREAISQAAASRGRVGQVPTSELLEDLLNASFANTTRPPTFGLEAATLALSAFTPDATLNNVPVHTDLEKAFTYRLKQVWSLKTPWHVVRTAFTIASSPQPPSPEGLPKQIQITKEGQVQLDLETEVTLFRDERLRPDRDSERHIVALSTWADKVVFREGIPLIASRTTLMGSERVHSWQFLSRTSLHRESRVQVHAQARTEYRQQSVTDEEARKRARTYAQLSSSLSKALGFATVFLTLGTLAPSVAFVIQQKNADKALLGWIGVFASVLGLVLTLVGWLKEKQDAKAEEAAHARDDFWSRNV